MKLQGLIDMMGGKAGAHSFVGGGIVSPTLTSGRGSISNVHVIIFKGE